MNARDRRLVGLNIGLVVTLGVVTLVGVTRSGAQPSTGAGGVGGGGGAGSSRPRGEYTLVSGKFQGSSASAVYILDVANQELVALDWDRNKLRFEPIGYRSLKDDANLFRGAR